MTTMIQAEDPTVHVGLIGNDVWAAALQQIHPGMTVEDLDEDLRVHWQAAGIVTESGLDELWVRAIGLARDANRATKILSKYRAMVFDATVLVDDDWAVVTTQRATVEHAEGVERIDKVHPMTEVAIGPRGRLWPLIRRVLPPLEPLRAEPRATHVEEATRLQLDLSSLPEAARASQELLAAKLRQLPELPGAVLDALEAEAEVWAHTIVATHEGVRASTKVWALGQHLTLFDPDTATAWQVPAGDLGHTLVEGLR